MEVKLSYEALRSSSCATSSSGLPCLQAMKDPMGAARLLTSSSLQLPDLKWGKERSKKLQVSCVIADTSLLDTALDSLIPPLIPPKSRRLILLRHGKSSWADSSLKDYDRPLNDHGRSASANLASKLHLVGWLPDLILCSDSVRTRETLNTMKECRPEFGDAEVHFLGSFYSVAAMDGQTAQHLQETICRYARNDICTVMCMGHNRGWEEAASILSGLSIELKTANAALLETLGSSWSEAFKSGAGGWTLSSIVKPDDTEAATLQ